MTEALIKKADDELQIVYAEVYAPNRPDAEQDFMTPLDVRMMAHEFLQKALLDRVDTQHDNECNGSRVVESWIQQEDSELYIRDAWVVGIHVPNTVIWKKIKDGEITGFSVEAIVDTEMVDVEIDVPPVITGTTIADSSGHVHKYTAEFNEDGVFLGGKTDVVNGHFHVLAPSEATRTQKAEGHSHGVYLMEGITLEVQS